MDAIGIGLIGTGFMGKCHALAFNAVKAVFGDTPAPVLEVLCDTPLEKAQALGAEFGFAGATDDWRELIADPAVDLVSITTPNKLHRDMALAAIEAGKHVWCEKPLALTLEDAREMRDAAAARGVRTMVGYNYLRNPALRHACEMIESDAIGRVFYFRGIVDEDYQADPETPWTWRCLKEEAGLGVLGDLGCHLVSLADLLMGPIESLIAEVTTVHESRPRPGGDGRGPVENEDIASALLRFSGGARGEFSCSRVAWGRKGRISLEIHGDRGMIAFDQERMNELRLYQNAGPRAEQGYKTILSGPLHPPYDRFCPAPGHGLSFNDLKTIEAAEFLRAIGDGSPAGPDFSEAYQIESVIHAIAESARTGQRVALRD